MKEKIRNTIILIISIFSLIISLISIWFVISIATQQEQLANKLSLEQQVGSRIESIENSLKLCSNETYSGLMNTTTNAKIEWQSGNSYKAFLILGEINQSDLEKLNRCYTEKPLPVVGLPANVLYSVIIIIIIIMILWLRQRIKHPNTP